MDTMDLNTMLHKDPVEVNPKSGQLLLAEPLMNDPVFGRSVIVILEQDSVGGHVGLCLNKGPICSLSDLCGGLDNTPDIPVYQGGPVDLERLFMLHKLGNRFSNALEIAPGLFIGAAEEEVMDYLLTRPDGAKNVRFFLGYSGWSAGQLTSEIMKNSWALNVHPDTTELLAGAGDSYWRREVGKLGPDYRSWLIVPENPSFN